MTSWLCMPCPAMAGAALATLVRPACHGTRGNGNRWHINCPAARIPRLGRTDHPKSGRSAPGTGPLPAAAGPGGSSPPTRIKSTAGPSPALPSSITGKAQTGEPGRGGWCALPWPVNVLQAYDRFSAAASFALCDVRINRLGPVHDGRCGDVQAVLGEREDALDQAERFRRGLPGPVEDAESRDGQVLGSQVRNRRWRGIWFAGRGAVGHDLAADRQSAKNRGKDAAADGFEYHVESGH